MRQFLRRAVHWTRLTLRQELGVEMAMQYTAEGVLEQAQPLVGDHEHLDLGAESPVLAARHLPQGTMATTIFGSHQTRRWREPDSNHGSRSCERLFWGVANRRRR